VYAYSTHITITESTVVALNIRKFGKILVCFLTSPTSIYPIHGWIHSQLQVSELSVLVIQIDVTRRQLFTKLTDSKYAHDIVQTTNGIAEYKHMTVKSTCPIRNRQNGDASHSFGEPTL
jgi:hypothetical protein